MQSFFLFSIHRIVVGRKGESMDNLIGISIIGLLVGVIGTGLGGILSLFLKNTNKIMSFLLGLTGGFMMFIVTFHLIPEAYYVAESLFVVISGIVLGILLVILIEAYIDIMGKSTYCLI